MWPPFERIAARLETGPATTSGTPGIVRLRAAASANNPYETSQSANSRPIGRPPRQDRDGLEAQLPA
jgi:hypothetical protein